MRPDFGVFEPVFQTAHGYLALLHLGSGDAPKAVELVSDCCRKIGDPFPNICRLLMDSNWRPHLVASVAVIISGYNADATKCLWRCIDTGSWVTPQIGVALRLVDPHFEHLSRIRLESGCSVDLSDLQSMQEPERHSAAGPAGVLGRSAKAAATLLQLLQTVSPTPSWLEQVSNSEDLRVLVAQDIDGSAAIADSWMHRIREITTGSR